MPCLQRRPAQPHQPRGCVASVLVRITTPINGWWSSIADGHERDNSRAHRRCIRTLDSTAGHKQKCKVFVDLSREPHWCKVAPAIEQKSGKDRRTLEVAAMDAEYALSVQEPHSLESACVLQSEVCLAPIAAR